jgi:hypothetical protein
MFQIYACYLMPFGTKQARPDVLLLLVLNGIYVRSACAEPTSGLCSFAPLCTREPSSGHLLATLRFPIVICLTALIRLFPLLCSNSARISRRT